MEAMAVKRKHRASHWRGRSVLVTGGAGFIGSNFIRYWLNTHPEDRLINLDVLSYAGNVENLRGIKESKKYTQEVLGRVELT